MTYSAGWPVRQNNFRPDGFQPNGLFGLMAFGQMGFGQTIVPPWDIPAVMWKKKLKESCANPPEFQLNVFPKYEDSILHIKKEISELLYITVKVVFIATEWNCLVVPERRNGIARQQKINMDVDRGILDKTTEDATVIRAFVIASVCKFSCTTEYNASRTDWDCTEFKTDKSQSTQRSSRYQC